MGQGESGGCLCSGERHLGTMQTITRPSINLNMTGSKDRETESRFAGEGERERGGGEAGGVG